MREVGEFDSVALVGAMTKAFLAPFETMDQIRFVIFANEKLDTKWLGFKNCTRSSYLLKKIRYKITWF
ncbi:hypothetical protein Hdeb2414_s0015g00452471 [Helianthus debilis subsp. tardiflorus]